MAAETPAARTAEAPMPEPERRRCHWRGNRRLISVLMAVWFVVTFGVAYFARELSFRFFGWPFSFWVAAQGALIVHLGIIWTYAHRMDRLDRTHGVAEGE